MASRLLGIFGFLVVLALVCGKPGPIPGLEEIVIDSADKRAPLKISAFNIQVFGVSKMDKPHVVAHLINILSRYDLTLIQEIRDASQTAIYDLLDQLNAQNQGDPYSIELSERLGRTSSKEQYAYFYKPSVYTVTDTYQEPEDRNGADKFERPPYTVRFRTSGQLSDFGFMGIHVKPDDAVNEIDYLADSYDIVRNRWNLDDIIIGGDFNAGCSYVRPGDWDSIRLRTQSRFQWIIGDNADTTIATSQCPYDRFVLAGSRLQSAYIQGSGDVFRFDNFYGLSREEAMEVSDHVPVVMDAN